ncbi:CTLH/CRA C-terminal to lish motif domain-containing protein [Blastocladiella britannica]|nr:CTLH/CRA C-terminal to lish motif domain-containing protein [Blastocladiella britannica]
MSADKIKLQSEPVLALEAPFARVPFEQLKRCNKKQQKHIEKELGNLTTAVSDLAKGKGPGVADPLKHLDLLADRVKKLKKKVSHFISNSFIHFWLINGYDIQLKELQEEELLYTNQTRARLHHLQELSHIKTLDAPAFATWTHTRLNRLIVDYLLRNGFLQSAKLLCKKGSALETTNDTMADVPAGAAVTTSTPSSLALIGGLVGSAPSADDTAGNTATNAIRRPSLAGADVDLAQFSDLEFFTQALKITASLDDGRCTEALAWCAENKTALKKIKSTLEFNLRLQEYIELVVRDSVPAALAYAKEHLTPFQDAHLTQIQQALGMLAFAPDTTLEPYRTLYDRPARWKVLREQFRADNFALHNVPVLSPLEAAMQAGMAALKTSQCAVAADRNPNCPVCVVDTFGALAQGLPLGHHVNSSYVCRITGALMNGDNPPLVTPEGYVYSQQAVHDTAAKNHGQFRCPRTGIVHPVKALKKMYLT